MRETHQGIRFGAAKLCALTLMALTLAACQPSTYTDGGQPAPGMLTDGNIAAIVLAFSDSEIDEANLALEKSRNALVREYAQLMITQHEWADVQTMEVLRRTNVTRVPNATVEQLQTRRRETLEALQTRAGHDFDRTYINNEVEMHRWAINTLDQSLLPGAQDDDLEVWLTQLRPVMVEHLSEAEDIQAALRR